MILLNSAFLIPLFIIGVICAFTDLKYGKIKNKWIAIGLIWTGLLYCFLVFYSTFFLHIRENVNYILELIINGAIALIIGYFLWQLKLWSAGDAKLFTLYALLIPLGLYSTSYFSYFPSLALLINTFFIMFLFLVAEAFFFSIKSGFKTAKQLTNIKNLPWGKWFTLKGLKPKIISTAKIYLNYIAFFIILRLGMQAITPYFTQKISSNFILFFLILFIARRYLLKSLIKNKKIMLSFGALIGGYIIYLLYSHQETLLLSILKMAFVFMILIGLSMKLLKLYIEKKEVRNTKIKHLKSGMVISELEIKEINKKIEKEKFKNKLGTIYPDGLTKEQVKLLKDLFKKEPEAEVKVYKTFAFAFFMLLAFLVTITIKGSIISFALNLFR